MVEPAYEYDDGELYCGDVQKVLAEMADESVQCIVTSPPYFGLRDYGKKGQIGLEETPQEYIQRLVEVFRELRRVLATDGVAWLNLGDSYWGGKGRSGAGSAKTHRERTSATIQGEHTYLGKKGGFRPTDKVHEVFKQKDLCLMPHRVAIALQEDGWWVRQDIVWHKNNPMPESVRDRCTKAHEYIFLLTKSKKYFYDHVAVKEPSQDTWKGRRGKRKQRIKQQSALGDRIFDDEVEYHEGMKRNRHSVWKVPVFAYKGAHFATYPPKLIEPCILAGCPEGGVVLDPFMGSGTTAIVARQHGRKFIGIDLNAEYLELADKRISSSE